MIEICLCTHNPRREALDLVLHSIAAQTVPAGDILFLLVDNASSPAVRQAVMREWERVRNNPEAARPFLVTLQDYARAHDSVDQAMLERMGVSSSVARPPATVSYGAA